MTEPGLELVETHRLLGVVELAGDGVPSSVTGDPSASVTFRNARLLAEGGDERRIDIGARQASAAPAEEHGYELACLGIR